MLISTRKLKRRHRWPHTRSCPPESDSLSSLRRDGSIRQVLGAKAAQLTCKPLSAGRAVSLGKVLSSTGPSLAGDGHGASVHGREALCARPLTTQSSEKRAPPGQRLTLHEGGNRPASPRTLRAVPAGRGLGPPLAVHHISGLPQTTPQARGPPPHLLNKLLS